jgi:hypothetical protein
MLTPRFCIAAYRLFMQVSVHHAIYTRLRRRERRPLNLLVQEVLPSGK